MKNTLYIITVAVSIAASALATDAPSFAAAAAESAQKFKTTQGGEYGIAFMRSAGQALVPAAQSCKGSTEKAGSYHDIVFIVAASGHISAHRAWVA